MPAFRQSIEFRDVTFLHEGSTHAALQGVSMTIRKGETVGLVGPSGAGKSTLVDLLTGLLKPASGCILIDGSEPETIPPGWNRSVGYVPQHIFLIDESLRRNIAFGIAEGGVDPGTLERAVDLANLTPVIEELEQGIDTPIGEDGNRLSGGQRQRVGIARALLGDPQLLILDEATSALDLETERSIVDAVDRLRGRLTTIIIAHHLSTVRNCDRVFLLEKGRITASGTYAELARNSDAFQRMIELTKPVDRRQETSEQSGDGTP